MSENENDGYLNDTSSDNKYYDNMSQDGKESASQQQEALLDESVPKQDLEHNMNISSYPGSSVASEEAKLDISQENITMLASDSRRLNDVAEQTSLEVEPPTTEAESLTVMSKDTKDSQSPLQIQDSKEVQTGSIMQFHDVTKAKQKLGYGDGYQMIMIALCALIILGVHFFSSLKRGILSTNSNKHYSVISGAGFGYLLIKGIPFVLAYLPSAAKEVRNIYLGDLEHLLLTVFGVISLGFVFNYAFEKRAARNMVEQLPHGPFLYGANLGSLGAVHFFIGLHLVTLLKTGSLLDLYATTIVISALLLCEMITLANTYTGRSLFFRKIFLSILLLLGIILRKMPFFDFSPLCGIFTYSFIMGYFIMSALRIEFATLKRSCDYTTFIISFSAVVALVVIESLYSSIGNNCSTNCAVVCPVS